MHTFEREHPQCSSLHMVSIFSKRLRCPPPALMSNSSIIYNIRRVYIRGLTNVRHCGDLLERAGNMGGAWQRPAPPTETPQHVHVFDASIVHLVYLP